MASFIHKGLALQTVLNTPAEVVIPTLLTVDGQMGWKINRVWATINTAAAISSAADANIELAVNTETGAQLFTDPDNICTLNWVFNGTAASTSAFQVVPDTEWSVADGRLTVQPNLYVRISSGGMIGMCAANFQIEYETVKLTNMEVMRLLQGGA